ncbi:MAG: efflux RND transporter periplasmic adaptor subunit [Bdellovibrionales bacterium]|nr:efflux RND transporter periplasmic adaptor subunit [Bdellovibrionales bacterium]
MTFLNKRNIALIVLLSALAGLLWQLSRGSNAGDERGKVRGQKGSTKRYGKVQRGDIIQRVTVSGLVNPLRKTVFVAPYSGYIKKMYVSIGEKIKAGQPVVSVVSNLTSPEQVFPIRAPFAGTVVDVPKSEGEYVTEKDPKDIMVRVDDLSKFFVIGKAPELEASRIRKNMEVEVRISAIGDEAIKGVVRTVDLAAAEADGWKQQQATFDVRVEILDPPVDIRPGQTAVIDITVNKFPDVLYLPHEFINTDAGKYFVITRAGKRKDVEVGRQSELAVEIVKGLSEGEEVEQIDFLKLLEQGS